VEKAWDVKVEDVRTARYAGKERRAFMGRFVRSAKVGVALLEEGHGPSRRR
jgi:ribosomal protein L23